MESNSKALAAGHPVAWPRALMVVRPPARAIEPSSEPMRSWSVTCHGTAEAIFTDQSSDPRYVPAPESTAVGLPPLPTLTRASALMPFGVHSNPMRSTVKLDASTRFSRLPRTLALSSKPSAASVGPDGSSVEVKSKLPPRDAVTWLVRA